MLAAPPSELKTLRIASLDRYDRSGGMGVFVVLVPFDHMFLSTGQLHFVAVNGLAARTVLPPNTSMFCLVAVNNGPSFNPRAPVLS